MADEIKQKNKSSRSARLGDRVFLWVEEAGELKPRVAFLHDYSATLKLWSLSVLMTGGVMIPYPGIPWSETPKSFHWTLADQVPAVPLESVGVPEIEPLTSGTKPTGEGEEAV